MNVKATVLCLVLLSATWMVAQTAGSAGSGAGHAGSAGQSANARPKGFTRKHKPDSG